MRIKHLIAATLALVAFAGTTRAITPEDKCEADKNRIAGKYAFCRQNAEAKAILKGGTADYSKCDSKLNDKWGKAEQKAIDKGTACIDSVSALDGQAFATAHADAVASALDGGALPDCGDGAINVAGEQCDGINLGGEDCTTLGFSGGTLACDGGCGFDTAACTAGGGGGFPASGETTAYGTGSDGDVQAGATLSYTDNGDGTVTDNNTGLMWEKKSDDGSIHDKDNAYTWGMTSPPYTMNGTMVTIFLDTLNDVGGGGANCFAGHCDWRIPNIKELYSIVNIENVNPSVSPAFNTACAPTCTVLACSCTLSNDYYWSSSTYKNSGGSVAWYVDFFEGFTNENPKSDDAEVRAVRGGV